MKRVSKFQTKPSMAIGQPRNDSTPPGSIAGVILSVIGESIGKKWISIISLSIGLFVGLVVLGWGLWPVEWTGATYAHLTEADRAVLVEMATDLNAYDPGNQALVELQSRWPGLDRLACFVAQTETVTQDEKIKLVHLAYKINQRGCE